MTHKKSYILRNYILIQGNCVIQKWHFMTEKGSGRLGDDFCHQRQRLPKAKEEIFEYPSLPLSDFTYFSEKWSDKLNECNKLT
jgi:hypothetical protein